MTLQAIALLGALITAPAGGAHMSKVQPLPAEWDRVALITGFHVVHNKAIGLDIRVLEASNTDAAWDPVALYVVATNMGTSDAEQHVWMLPMSVERVRKISNSKCGADLIVEVDTVDDQQMVSGTHQEKIKFCVVGSDGKLSPTLEVSDEPVQGKTAKPSGEQPPPH